MTILFVRVFFGILAIITGFYVGSLFIVSNVHGPLIGAVIGFLAAAILILIETFMWCFFSALDITST